MTLLCNRYGMAYGTKMVLVNFGFAPSKTCKYIIFQSTRCIISSGLDMATPPSPASAMESGRYSMLTVSPLRTTAVLIGFDRATPRAPALAFADGFRYILVTGLVVLAATSLLSVACVCSVVWCVFFTTIVFLSQLGPPTLGVFGCIGLSACTRCLSCVTSISAAAAAVVGASSTTASGRVPSTVTSPLSKFTATDPDVGHGAAAEAVAPGPILVPAPGQTPNVGMNAQYGSGNLRIQ